MRCHNVKLLINSAVPNSLPSYLRLQRKPRNLLVPLSSFESSYNCNYATSLTQNRVLEFIRTLKDDERQMLIEAVKKFESDGIKFAVPEGETTVLRWRSEFGRPSKITRVDESEPDEKDVAARKPARKELIRLGLYNAIPFVGFGFLDNTIMILGGDSIELMVGSIITITTMTAAALGNTLSDIISIGSALYVEKFAVKLGVKKPDLSVVQLNSNSSRFAANLGRTLGVTVGCIIGMFPLLFK